MDENPSIQRTQHQLQVDLSGFLNYRAPWLPELGDTLRRLSDGLEAFLFGGLLRDLAIYGMEARPRDIDIVISGASQGQLAEVLRPYIQRQTKFGGFQLMVGGVEVDVWPLEATWAFKRMGIASPTFADLPHTTFLNIEAATAELPFRQDGLGRMYTFGFFEALSQRTIEINFEENPYPELCLARSLDLASRLGFSIGPRLSRFAGWWLERLTEDKLLLAHRAAHGVSPCPSCLFLAWGKAIAASETGYAVPPPSIQQPADLLSPPE